ncbi:MAG: DUF2007 domain-containing protein [Candidatus Marinimicrobia bacterium]|nr:DUF2007 domain-containing protein [Candidatus Neomarinimicrobiota bacterium]
MPFCPKCKYEFTEGVKTCPDCGEKLVDTLNEDEIVDVKWVPVGTLKSSMYGDMARELLEKNDIPALVVTDFFHGALATSGTGLAGTFAKIYVPEGSVNKAREILKEHMDIDLS